LQGLLGIIRLTAGNEPIRKEYKNGKKVPELSKKTDLAPCRQRAVEGGKKKA